jgi:hypothetical protein
MMMDALILDKAIDPFRCRPAIQLLSGNTLCHRGNHRRLLGQNSTNCQRHHPPQAFFWQQFRHGRDKLVQRLVQFFNWHLGEDLV